MTRAIHIMQTFLILLTGFAALKLAGMYPFYYSWDMDLTILQDMLLLQDDQLPTHYIHPGFGMNYVLFWVYDIAQNLGLITKVSIANFGEALQPLLVIAEQMDFLRQVNAIFCIMLAVVFWQALSLMFPSSKWRSTLLLVLCLLMPSLWNYDIALIRTETYSLLFWTMALLFTLTGASETTDEKRLNRFIYCIGFFSALSFFTKIQSFFLITLLPLLFFYLRPTHAELKPTSPFSVKKFVWSFLAISAVSIVMIFPDHVTTFKSNWLPNKFFMVLGFLIYLIYAVQNKKKYVVKWLTELNSWVEFLKKYLLGASLVLLLPLIAPMNFFTSVYHSILTFKVIFWRHAYVSELGQFSLIENLSGSVGNNIVYFVLFAAGFGFLIFAARRVQEKKKSIILVGMLVILLLHSLVGVRDRMQDRMWLEFPFILFAVIAISKLNLKMQTFALAVVLLVQVYVLTQFQVFRKPPGAAYSDPDMFFTEVYSFGQYQPVLKKSYDSIDKIKAGIRFAVDWKRWKSLAVVNFPEADLDLKKLDIYKDGIRINFKELTHFKYQFTPDQALSIITPSKLKDTVKSDLCILVQETEIEINQKKYVQRLYRGNRRDPWTNQLMPDLCEFKNLNLEQQFVVLNPRF